MENDRIKLSAVTTILSSGGRPKGGATTQGIPSIGAEHLNGIGGFDFSNLKYVPHEFYINLKSGKIEKDDILIVKDGATTGKISFVDEHFPYKEASINEHVFKLALDKGTCYPKYIYYYLRSNEGQRQLMSDFRGATVGGISRAILECIKVNIPSLTIQRKIADTLDQCSCLIVKDDILLKKYDELAQSTFNKMFGDTVTNEKKWECKKMDDLLHFLTSGSRGWAQFYTESSGDVFLRINNVGRNKLLLKDLMRVQAPDNAEAVRTEVKSGDILFSITADLGRTAVIPAKFPKAFINQHLALLRLKEGIDPIYVSQFLSTEGVQRQIQNANKGGVKAGLNFNDIRNIKILIPPFDLQKKYARIYAQINELIEKQIVNSSYSNSLMLNLMNRYFS